MANDYVMNIRIVIGPEVEKRNSVRDKVQLQMKTLKTEVPTIKAIDWWIEEVPVVESGRVT